MAGTSLLALLDDIATLLDDVAIYSKAAATKTSGVLGDDLALTAEQVSGIKAERELPVIFAVAKGSLINKCILVPAALALNFIFPSLVMALLMIGGAYLCYEGFEKIAHKLLHDHNEDIKQHKEKIKAIANKAIDMVAFEKEKIKGAVRTDFILSAEIIVITLGVVKDSAFATQLMVLSVMALLITFVVYGFVGIIVKMDDAGLHLMQTSPDTGFKNASGKFLLRSAPYLMKTLSIVGTAAMFMVGGGILTHGLPFMHHFIEYSEDAVRVLPYIGNLFSSLSNTLISTLFGILAGGILVGIHQLINKFKN